jgi:hypothetical protein
MASFLRLLRFCESDRNGSPDHEGLSTEDVREFLKISQKVKHIETALTENPDIQFAANGKSGMIDPQAMILQTLCPGMMSINNIKTSKLVEKLNALKKKRAIYELHLEGLNMTEISDKIETDKEEVNTVMSNLPATVVDSEFSKIKKEATIRNFFKLNPYATIEEASKTIKLTNKEIRSLIKDMEAYGEKIPYSNVMTEVEEEKIKDLIVAIKSDDPSVTDKDISTRLNIPLSQVRRALREAIRIWQVERNVTYDFYLTRTIRELEMIKDLCMERHNAGEATSSRWAEIYLVAEEKIINILGLKAPEKLDIRNEIVDNTKEHRDEIIAAWMETDAIDVDYNKIEVTGN